MESRITEVAEAWNAIEEAVHDGVFVPVLGFDIASSIVYADAGQEGRGGLLREVSSSAQHRELAEVAARVHDLTRFLESSADGDASESDGQCSALECEDGMVAKYAAKVAAVFDKYALEDGQHESPDCSDPLFRLQLAIVRLTAVLTAEWAFRLNDQPIPIGTTYAAHTTPITDSSQHWAAIGLLREALDACLSLASSDLESSALDTKQLEWMYVKLLRLAAQLVGGSPDLWAVTQFARVHSRAIGQLTRQGVKVDWHLGDDGRPCSEVRGQFGVTFAHLIWLEELLRFTLLSNARAYRTRSELAFALSLDDPGVGIPRMPADPFEIGLLYSDAGSRDMEVIQRILHFCSLDDSGDPRIPGGFHRTIAKMMKHAVQRLSESEAEHDKQAAQKQVIISLGMDMEMERALEEHFDTYRVLLPVFIAVRADSQSQIADDVDEPYRHHPRPAWLMGRFTRQGDNYDVSWTDTSCEDVELADAGPLLIKLFGSPAQPLPSAVDLSTNPNIDVDAPAPNPSHRLVLDEMELMNLLFRLVPDERHIRGLRHRLRSSRLFFFGQDALTWGDRIPYLIVDAIKGSSDQTHGTLEASAARSVGGWGRGRGKDQHSRPRYAAVAVAEADLFGRGAWSRLQVVGVDSQRAHPSAIVSRIVEEVAKW